MNIIMRKIRTKVRVQILPLTLTHQRINTHPPPPPPMIVTPELSSSSRKQFYSTVLYTTNEPFQRGASQHCARNNFSPQRDRNQNNNYHRIISQGRQISFLTDCRSYPTQASYGKKRARTKINVATK